MACLGLGETLHLHVTRNHNERSPRFFSIMILNLFNAL